MFYLHFWIVGMYILWAWSFEMTLLNLINHKIKGSQQQHMCWYGSLLLSVWKTSSFNNLLTILWSSKGSWFYLWFGYSFKTRSGIGLTYIFLCIYLNRSFNFEFMQFFSPLNCFSGLLFLPFSIFLSSCLFCIRHIFMYNFMWYINLRAWAGVWL